MSNEVTRAGETLADQGFRLVIRRKGGVIVLATWLERHAMLPGDVDCTDMNDDEFEREVTR